MTQHITLDNPVQAGGYVTICIEDPAPSQTQCLDIEMFDKNGDELQSFQVRIVPPDNCVRVQIPNECWGGFVSDPTGAMQTRAIVVA